MVGSPNHEVGGAKLAKTDIGHRFTSLTLFLAIFGFALGAGAAGAPAHAADPDADAAIEFLDVLERPTDLTLNLRYARQQIAAGHVVSAANALERLVISHPQRHDIRFSLAVLLYRMGNLSQSEGHLRILQANTLPRDLEARVDEYLAAIAERQRRWAVDAEIAAGLQFDTNRNSYPVSGQFSVLSTNQQGTGQEDGDIARLAFAGLTASYDPEIQEIRSVNASLDFFISDQVELDRLDLLGLAVELSSEIDWRATVFIPNLSYVDLGVGDKGYLREVSGGLKVERALPWFDRVLGFVDLTHGYQSFNDQAAISFADEQSGSFSTAEIGFDWLVSGPLRVGASYKHVEKNARTDYEEFGEDGAKARIVWVPFARAFVATEAGLSWRDYKGPDPFISATTTRDDFRYGAEATFGVALSEVIRPLSDTIADALGDDTAFLLSAEYTKVDSNLPNYEYDNTTIRALFTHRFSVY